MISLCRSLDRSGQNAVQTGFTDKTQTRSGNTNREVKDTRKHREHFTEHFTLTGGDSRDGMNTQFLSASCETLMISDHSQTKDNYLISYSTRL